MRPEAAEIIELPEARARRERFESALGRQFDPEVLARVKIGERARAEAARLNDPSFEVRERAVRALLDDSVTDQEVHALLDRGSFDDEAHERLLSVALRRILERPRGALGIRMGTSPPPRPGVLVQATIPGMPADKVLRAGDVIETLDGRALTDSSELAEGLQAHGPGNEVALTVLRTEQDPQGRPMRGADGQPVQRRIELRVPLGNANDLDRAEPGMQGGFGVAQNLVNQQRRVLCEVVRERFTRPLPTPVAVTPAPAP